VHQSIQRFLAHLLPRSPMLPAAIDPGTRPAPPGGAAANASNDPFGVIKPVGPTRP
jgi:hypothetical protein